jgi:hypothetical protein
LTASRHDAPGLLVAAARALPVVAAIAASTSVLAWREHGSISATHWLPVAILIALLVAVVLGSGAAHVPHPLALIGLASTAALAVLAFVSLKWSPLPTLARDEGLLTLAYAGALALPLLVLHNARSRIFATASIAASSGLLAVAVAIALIASDDPESLYRFERLNIPVSYPNATAAVFLIGFWPALLLGASRGIPRPARALALAAATASVSGWLLTQSKGGALSLGVSAALILAVVPGRMRLLVPTAVVAGLAAAGFSRLTGPYRIANDAVAIPAAGRALLVLTAIGFVVGLAYAFLDGWLTTTRRVERAAGVGVAVVALVAAAVALAAVGRPDRAVEDAWQAFTAGTERPNTSSTHLLSLGSNRYDMWRVAIAESPEHPVLGVGARGFGPLYLQEGRTGETPARAHSLLLEVLVEQGGVGLLLLLVGVGAPLLLIARQARQRSVSAVAALGGCCGWLAHASVDWIWTFAAAGIPFFLLLGIGASGVGRPALARWVALPATGITALAAALVLAPPWISGRLVERALIDQSDAKRDLDRARQLDPIAVRPLLAEAQLAPSAVAALPPLAEAAKLEPRSVSVRYLYGMTLLEAGRPARALRELAAAKALAPREPIVSSALRRARGARGRADG